MRDIEDAQYYAVNLDELRSQIYQQVTQILRLGLAGLSLDV
jgi:hypothetical protein